MGPCLGLTSAVLKGILKQWIYFSVDWVSQGRIERQKKLGGGLEKKKEPPTSGFCLGITEMTDPVTYPQRIILLFLREKCCGDG